MNRPFVIRLLSGLFNLFICLVATVAILYKQNWFGSGDTWSFIFWTIPFAIALSVCGRTIINLFQKFHISLKLLLLLITAVLLSFGWAYCVSLLLGPWIGAFSIPILYLWIGGSFAQLLFLSWRLPASIYKTQPIKVIFGLLAFPLTLIAAVVLMYLVSFASSYLTRPDKETFLMPKNFGGSIYVIYNQKNGQPKEYEGKRRVYRIPDNGILFTQFNDEYGIIDQEYYFVDKAGKRTKIKFQDSHLFNEEWTTVKNKHEPSRDSIAVWDLSVGSMGGNSTEDATAMKFATNFIGTYNQLRVSEDKLSYEKADSIRTEYLKNKRAK